MTNTLLAVDDSVTMRKVLEITFAGPEFRIVTANSPDAALQKLKTEKPDLVIADVSLEPMSGYDLCKAIKEISPATPVLILSSRHNPFDAAKASAAQADDHMDKPYDTQQMIDKVKKLLGMRVDAKATATPATSPVRAPVTMPAIQVPTGAAAAGPVARAKTLIYTPNTPAQAPAAAPSPSVSSAVNKTLQGAVAPTPQRISATAPTPAAGSPVAAAAAVVTGPMASKLEALGLTPAQVDAVTALSREVVERVVWEVVPVLAETIIKEELARLTK